MSYIGIAALAAMNKRFDTQAFLAQYPETIRKPAMSVLTCKFGKRWDTLAAFCRRFRDRPHLIELYISNGPGRRGATRDKANFLDELSVAEFNAALKARRPRVLKRIERRVNWIQNSVGKFVNGNTQIILCPELEDNLTDAAFQVFAHEILFSWPVLIARNPYGGGKKGGHFTEFHGARRRAGVPGTIVSLDGVSIEFHDGEAYSLNGKRNAITVEQALGWLRFYRHPKSIARFLWLAHQQGLGDSVNWAVGAPRASKRKYVFSAKAHIGVRKLLEEGE